MNPSPEQVGDDAGICVVFKHVNSAGIAQLARVEARIDALQNYSEIVRTQSAFHCPRPLVTDKERRSGLGIDFMASKLQRPCSLPELHGRHSLALRDLERRVSRSD